MKALLILCPLFFSLNGYSQNSYTVVYEIDEDTGDITNTTGAIVKTSKLLNYIHFGKYKLTAKYLKNTVLEGNTWEKWYVRSMDSYVFISLGYIETIDDIKYHVIFFLGEKDQEMDYFACIKEKTTENTDVAINQQDRKLNYTIQYEVYSDGTVQNMYGIKVGTVDAIGTQNDFLLIDGKRHYMVYNEVITINGFSWYYWGTEKEYILFSLTDYMPHNNKNYYVMQLNNGVIYLCD